MLGSAGWTGAVRWLVAALFVAVLSLSPTIDSLLCGNDLSVGSAAAAESIVLGDQAITFPQDDHGTAATDVCVHGHCHHFAPFVPAQNVADVGLALHRIKQDVERDSVRKTDLHFGLKRPPRA